MEAENIEDTIKGIVDELLQYPEKSYLLDELKKAVWIVEQRTQAAIDRVVEQTLTNEDNHGKEVE